MSNISSDVPAWNKLHESYYEYLFAFAKSNLYDHGVLVLAHCASANVYLGVFLIGHILTTFTSSKVGSV